MDTPKQVIPEWVHYAPPEVARRLLRIYERSAHDAGLHDDPSLLAAAGGDELLVERIHSAFVVADAEKHREKESKKHMEPPAREFTPLDLLPALSNAAMLGVFAAVTWTREAGIWTALGAFGLWLGVFIALRVDRPPQRHGSENTGILDRSDRPPILPRVRTGEDAEQILKKFHRGEPL